MNLPIYLSTYRKNMLLLCQGRSGGKVKGEWEKEKDGKAEYERVNVM